MILMFGSHKGGVGKSTMLIMILIYLMNKRGKKCAILECDDQRSIKDWATERINLGLSTIDYFESYTSIADKARKLNNTYDYVFLDSPGKKSPEFRKGLSCADVLLSFIDPTAQIEINTLAQLVADVKEAQTLNTKLSAWLILNRCPTDPRDTEASSLRSMLNDDPDWLPVPRQRIFYRKAYKTAYNTGMGVHEYNDKSRNKARAEIELLVKELKII
ncbi:putative plasmid partition protein A [Candidatus Sodalis pierantonius str. SOPE]|uniref:Putative plasmid partition protein A n=2 Tax=Sodalis TaxID=84565 RepID=W0HLR9_9GAMM|nr:division plane positioning ATPase MipZ [Candidatus Sodalis pierantonius]AHF74789.1 putative plasmid partition protein A [Candidatus Sodalis pierantonius str. SOPE]